MTIWAIVLFQIFRWSVLLSAKMDKDQNNNCASDESNVSIANLYSYFYIKIESHYTKVCEIFKAWNIHSILFSLVLHLFYEVSCTCWVCFLLKFFRHFYKQGSVKRNIMKFFVWYVSFWEKAIFLGLEWFIFKKLSRENKNDQKWDSNEI